MSFDTENRNVHNRIWDGSFCFFLHWFDCEANLDKHRLGLHVLLPFVAPPPAKENPHDEQPHEDDVEEDQEGGEEEDESQDWTR